MAHLWTKTPMYSRTTGALARPTPPQPDNRSAPLFRFFLSPLYKTVAKERQQKQPPRPKSLARGAPATGWRQERCAAHSEQVALGPSSITDQSRERGRGRGSNCGDVRKREGEGERESARQRKQTGQRLQCVSGQRGVSECSPPLFSRAKTPGGLSAPGAVIYHQSGKAGPPLWPVQPTQDSHTHTNRCVSRTHIQMCNHYPPSPIRTCISKNDTFAYCMCAKIHMVDGSIKNRQMCGYKIHVVDICVSLKETHKEVIKPMWNEI